MKPRIHKYADGGKVVVKKPPMKKPEKGGTPKRITTDGKPGDTGPGGANPARNRKKKYADGGKVYGAPMDRPTNSSDKGRPKVGDKDPNYKPRKPRKPPTSSKPKAKPGGRATVFRDYRGTKGAIEDAGG